MLSLGQFFSQSLLCGTGLLNSMFCVAAKTTLRLCRILTTFLHTSITSSYVIDVKLAEHGSLYALLRYVLLKIIYMEAWKLSHIFITILCWLQCAKTNTGRFLLLQKSPKSKKHYSLVLTKNSSTSREQMLLKILAQRKTLPTV